MMRFCPNCETARSPEEIFCEGEIDQRRCDWPLSSIPIRPDGWRPPIAAEVPAAPPAPTPACINGHPVDAGDLLCAECGGDVAADVPAAMDVRSAADTPDQDVITRLHACPGDNHAPRRERRERECGGRLEADRQAQ